MKRNPTMVEIDEIGRKLNIYINEVWHEQGWDKMNYEKPRVPEGIMRFIIEEWEEMMNERQ